MIERDLAALFAFIESRQSHSFAWLRGADCVSFALAGVEAQTGVDLLADIPRWRTRKEALAVTRSVGGLRAALDARMDRVEPAFAQRGDVAGLPDKAFGVRLMLVEGQNLVGPGGDRLHRLDRSAMAIAWSAPSARRVAL